MQLVKALGSWEQLVQDAMAKRRAMAGFFQSGSKKAITMWKAFAADEVAKKERARATLRRFSPDGRAKTKALNAWKHMLEMHYTMKGALQRLFNRQLSKCYEQWQFQMEQAKRREAGLFRALNYRLLRAFNQWLRSPSKARLATARLPPGVCVCVCVWKGTT